MAQILSDETIRALLREGKLAGDAVLVAMCHAALFGSLEARNQLLAVFKIAERYRADGSSRRPKGDPGSVLRRRWERLQLLHHHINNVEPE